MSVAQIARLVGETPRDIETDLVHLLKSLKHTEYTATVEPADGPVIRTEGARIRGVEIARAWARADPESTQPILQLAQSYMAARMPDSARLVLERLINERAQLQMGKEYGVRVDELESNSSSVRARSSGNPRLLK